jgi:hypothetical protein
MEIKLDLELKQVVNILKQLSVSDWEKLKNEIEKDKKVNKVFVPETENTEKRLFGSMKGLVLYMADDFDAPLDDFKEYME